MEYAVLNISEDPAAQGIELAKYDLVIASNVCSLLPFDYIQVSKI
jgi:hypothetical protein